MKSVTFMPQGDQHQHGERKTSIGIGVGDVSPGTGISPSAQSWLGTFDAEEDHLLDYFLSSEQTDGATGAGSSTSSTTKISLSHNMPCTIKEKNKPASDGHANGTHSISISAADSKSQMKSLSRSKHPPATPDVQFYASHFTESNTKRKDASATHFPQQGQQQQQEQQQGLLSTISQSHQQVSQQPQQSQTKQFQMVYLPTQNLSTSASAQSTSKSSSSSPLGLQGMSSTPILHMHQQFQAQASANINSMSNVSPISPAGMCTNEVLMLPTGSGSAHQIISNQQRWQQQHTQNGTANTHAATSQLPLWLQHMSNVASMASQAAISSAVPVPAPAPSTQTQSTNQAAILPIPNRNQMYPQVQVSNATVFPGQTDILPIPGSVPQNFQQHHHHHHHKILVSAIKEGNVIESKEKRERRLARNRESARQSRRRKKELLLNRRAQVNKLHGEIETERRKKLETMEEDLVVDKLRILNEIFLEQSFHNSGDNKTNGFGRYDRAHVVSAIPRMEKLVFAVRKGGPNIVERQTAVRFQYNALRQLFLPFYRQIFLSLSLKEQRFFTSSKEHKMKSQKTGGRVSSKTVGEEITKKHADDLKQPHGAKQNLSCGVNDSEMFWPLFCYELSIGIDQEEKLLQAFESIRGDSSMKQTRAKISVATTMVSNLRDGLLSHCNSIANHNEVGLLQILTPLQSIRFLEWFLRNKSRCSNLLLSRRQIENSPVPIRNSNEYSVMVHDNESMPKVGSDHSLNTFCQQLTDTMSIKKQDGWM